MVSVVSLVSVSNAIKTQRHGGTENNNKFSEDTEILSFLKIQREIKTLCLCASVFNNKSVPLCLNKKYSITPRVRGCGEGAWCRASCHGS